MYTNEGKRFQRCDRIKTSQYIMKPEYIMTSDEGESINGIKTERYDMGKIKNTYIRSRNKIRIRFHSTDNLENKNKIKKINFKQASRLTTCNKLVVNKLSQAMQTHPDIGLL